MVDSLPKNTNIKYNEDTPFHIIYFRIKNLCDFLELKGKPIIHLESLINDQSLTRQEQIQILDELENYLRDKPINLSLVLKLVEKLFKHRQQRTMEYVRNEFRRDNKKASTERLHKKEKYYIIIIKLLKQNQSKPDCKQRPSQNYLLTVYEYFHKKDIDFPWSSYNALRKAYYEWRKKLELNPGELMKFISLNKSLKAALDFQNRPLCKERENISNWL
jgi:hypothetical protein